MVTQQSGVWGISIYFDPSTDINIAVGGMKNWWEARFTFTVTSGPVSPSSIPSSSPTPLSSVLPSPASPPVDSPSICLRVEFDVVISVKTDARETENKWTLSSSSGGSWVSPPFSAEYETYTSSYCLPRVYCYIFTIYDTYGDGILDPGTFSLTVDGDVLLEDGDDGFSSISAIFGDCGGPTFPTCKA